MKLTPKYRGQLLAKSRGDNRRKSSGAFHDAIATARRVVLQDNATAFPQRGHLLRLALNEAEALAWQTDFPHLFFPQLAAEKVRTVAAWQRKQQAIQTVPREVAFAA